MTTFPLDPADISTLKRWLTEQKYPQTLLRSIDMYC